MPVEIKELVIRAIVAEEPPDTVPSAEEGSAARKTIIEECVRQVLAILRKSAER